MKKKILFVNSSLSGGGSERVMCLLANQFYEEEYDVTMLLVRESDKQTYRINPNIKLVKFKYPLKNKIFKLLYRIYKIRREMKQNNSDCVISFMSDINLVTLFASIGLKKKVIVSERADPSHSGRSKFHFFLERILYQRADKIVLQTEYVKQFFSKRIQKKCFIIPNPINNDIPDCFNGKRKKVIVAAGRLTKQKNFSLLIDAFFEFHKQKKDYILEIYGEGPLKDELQDMISNYHLNESAFLKGYVDDVDEKMRTASIYVSSSDFEGISNSMLEALAMGIPSICTDCPVGGARLMIKNNVNGILISVGDKEKLVSAMKKITGDENFAQKLSDNAIKISEKYSVEKIAKMWIDFF